ncbi:MAG TPA: sigma factor [Pyrinomonadaceae bacterium]
MTTAKIYPARQSSGLSGTADDETSPVSDYALTRIAAEGDMQAFEELYRRHHRRVYSICLRMTQSVEVAEDLAQETFTQLFRKV